MATVLIIGRGAREHALAYKLSQSANVTRLLAAPGNPGIAQFAECLPVQESNISAIVELARKEQVALVVVGPEVPLVLGLVDELKAHGIACFGPNKACAQLEGSKQFAKSFMQRNGIPTAAYQSFTEAEKARAFIETLPKDAPIVLKADGLAQGKGVVIAQDHEEALQAINEMMEQSVFGDAGSEVVIERFLEGEEVSLLTFVDGHDIVAMLPVQDHKRIGEGDTGLNTGGMGTYCPTSVYTDDVAKRVQTEIVAPIAQALKKEGLDYRGCLYIGLMLTKDGPQVIEFNVRFGDPETQCLMLMLESDLYDIMRSCVDGTLASQPITWRAGYSLCVIMASGGYPEAYETGKVIRIASQEETIKNAYLFHAGTAFNAQHELVTQGGRVIAVTAVGETFNQAQQRAYQAVSLVDFSGRYFRRDIGFREKGRI